MRAVVQRVTKAKVEASEQEISQIEAGFLVLLAVKVGDNEAQAHKIAEKIAKLRVITDADDKMNLSVLAIAQVLLILLAPNKLCHYLNWWPLICAPSV